MGDLSKRLSRAEFQCKCTLSLCQRTPVDGELVKWLEDCADHFLTADEKITRVIIHINSGHRCAEHDRNIKIKIAEKRGEKYTQKTKKSEHLFGWAADFWLEWEYWDASRKKIPDDDIADYLIGRHIAKFGVGRYNGRTHFDIRQSHYARWDNR